MDNLVTSLDTSQRLKTHGVDQSRASFFWAKSEIGQDIVIHSSKEDAPAEAPAAFTGSEIVNFLKGFGDWVTYNKGKKTSVRFISRDGGIIDVNGIDNEADARGLVLAGMLDKGIIKLKGKLNLL